MIQWVWPQTHLEGTASNDSGGAHWMLQTVQMSVLPKWYYTLRHSLLNSVIKRYSVNTRHWHNVTATLAQHLVFTWLPNPLPAKFFNSNFHPLKAVSRYRDPQLQVTKNDSHLFKLRPNFLKILMFIHTFNYRYQWFDRLIKRIKTTIIL